MSKIFISKENEYNEQELAVIAVLNWMQNKKHENIVTSIQSIAYVMCGRFPKTRIRKDRTLMDNIRKAIDSLREQKMISILEQDGDNYVFSKKGLEVDCEIESVWGEPEPIEQFNIEDTFEVETA